MYASGYLLNMLFEVVSHRFLIWGDLAGTADFTVSNKLFIVRKQILDIKILIFMKKKKFNSSNVKAILAEGQQYCYLTNSWVDKRFHTFSKLSQLRL